MSNRCVVVVAALTLFTISNGAVWYVHPDSAMNCIQHCLDSCSTGDTVLVGPGIYYENIVWPGTQGIDLISEHGPDSTTIHGYNNGRAIEMASASIDTTTLIEGFTIRRGLAGAGAGMYISSCSPIIRDNVITDNECNGFSTGGGGILCYSYATPIIENNTISYNTSVAYGGGIYCYNSSPTITGNTIVGNQVDSIGAGILCYQSSPYIANNTICYDSARWGGGATVMYESHPLITNNTINDNFGYASGGGIYCYQSSSPTITWNTITNNTCILNMGYYGAGIRCSSNSNPTIKFCTFLNNYTTGITIYNSSPSIDSCSIEFNMLGVYHYGGGSPNVTMSNICSNSGYEIYNATNDTFAAEYNWWGDSTGPPAIFGLVDYDPWLTDSVCWQLGIAENKQTTPLICNLTITPNPFTQITDIRYLMTDNGITQSEQSVNLKIYDVGGRLVRDFGQLSVIGHQSSVQWFGDDNAGRKLPSGVYFITLQAGAFSETEKVLLLR